MKGRTKGSNAVVAAVVTTAVGVLGWILPNPFGLEKALRDPPPVPAHLESSPEDLGHSSEDAGPADNGTTTYPASENPGQPQQGQVDVDHSHLREISRSRSTLQVSHGNAERGRIPSSVKDRGVPTDERKAKAANYDGPTLKTADDHQLITASGIGYPPDNVKEEGRRDALAKRAAKVDGLRNLAESIQLQLKSDTTITSQIVTEDEVRATVEEILKGVITIKEEKQPDGGFEVTVGVRISSLE